jgi:hypothetical protein
MTPPFPLATLHIFSAEIVGGDKARGRYSVSFFPGSPSSKWSDQGHFTHGTERPWPLHFLHSCWWKRRSRSKFASHYAWGTNRVCECKVDARSTWIPTWHRMDHVSWSLRFSKTTSWEVGLTQNQRDHGTLNAHKRWFILYDHVCGPAWIEICWNNIWLRA